MRPMLVRLAAFALLAGLAVPVRAAEESPRALWVVRDALLSPESIDRMVDDAVRAGVTDLFVQVRGRGDAYYRSDLAPTADPLRDAWNRTGIFDPLDRVLGAAHARGLRVHAWMNVYLVAPAGLRLPEGHVVRDHPDWVALDARGRSLADYTRNQLSEAHTEGIFLDPGNAEVVAHYEALVRELLAAYPLDGIHLDYVRYPWVSAGFSGPMRHAFRNRYGIDPVELSRNEDALIARHGLEGYRRLLHAWADFRVAQVTALVRQVRKAQRETRPTAILSAAVKPEPGKAASHYGQDWVSWVDEGLIDVVAPMMYTTDTDEMRRQARAIAAVVPPGKVWAGVAIYNQSLESAERKVAEARAAGLGGVSIFSYNAMPAEGAAGLRRLTGGR